MKPGRKKSTNSGITLGVSADGVVSQWAREAALDRDLTVRCAGCGWSDSGPARQALKAQAKHRKHCTAVVAVSLSERSCHRGHVGRMVERPRAATGRTYRACRECEAEAQRRTKARREAATA